MLYVHQSLAPNEEILTEAHFHWMYTVSAVFWIVFGLATGIAVGYGGIWMSVAADIRNYYPDLPSEMFDQAWAEVVAHHGGYLDILWSLHPVFRFSILGFFILGVFLFANMMVVKATTEIAITNERLIYKKGLIARDMGEMSIDRIEGKNVHQSVSGRIFGYGRVSVRGMGVGEVMLPPIDDPIGFCKTLQEAMDMQGSDNKTEAVDHDDEF